MITNKYIKRDVIPVCFKPWEEILKNPLRDRKLEDYIHNENWCEMYWQGCYIPEELDLVLLNIFEKNNIIIYKTIVDSFINESFNVKLGLDKDGCYVLDDKSLQCFRKKFPRVDWGDSIYIHNSLVTFVREDWKQIPIPHWAYYHNLYLMHTNGYNK